ncbi:MAG TPA: hypothetical protein VHO70_03390 [Chitinispirillaceae bacterium]|nr:hypothetical protein [Chitinispirillaceae bacterium]
MQISEATSALFKQLSTTEDFSAGAKKLASFFRATEEHLSPGSLLTALLDNNFSSVKMVEYVLFSLLDTGVSDFDLMCSLLHFPRLQRLLGKEAISTSLLSTTEQCLLKKLRDNTPVKDFQTLNVALNIIKGWIEQFVNGEEPGPLRRKQLAALYECEADALRARSDWLSENVDTYNMKKMMRLLPLISLCDEYAKSIIDLSELIRNGTIPGAPVLSLEQSMKTDAFEKWCKQISRQPELAFFYNVLIIQRNKLIPTRLLTAVSSISRIILKDDPSPLSWIAFAIGNCKRDSFSIESTVSPIELKNILNGSGAEINGNKIEGDFTKNSFAQFIGDDRCTRELKNSGEIPIREMVNRCMKNDTLLARLLDNPKVYNSPGLVERIAHTSHSHFILQKIAVTRELHTGQANVGVPLVLLKNSSNIPITQLRQFINPRYVSMIEMKDLLKFPFSIRREVYNEVQSFMERKR